MTSSVLSRASTSGAFLILTALAGSAFAVDAKPGLRLVTASDLAAGPIRLELPGAGDYDVWILDPEAKTWAVNSSGGAVELRFAKPRDRIREKKTSGSERLAWRRNGRMTYDPKSPPTLRIDPPGEEGSPDEVPVLVALYPAKAPGESAEKDKAPPDLVVALDLVHGDLKSTDPISDPRRTTSRTRDEGANFRTPPTRQAWLDRAEHVRTQVRVALGLWPIWQRTELNPKVFGKIDRDGYTIEKVELETLPGFTLCGNLYRPKGKAGRLPLVLCPHGHWKDGRMNPEVQARCVWWAKRLGCVVFMYDMVGYNDSKPFGHVFLDDRLRRWGLSLPTLQTWNSIRALDWATTLPDVDPARVGVTGESGGGTQTFLLTAIDPRVKVAAPVVMVSHKMQGGCVCENCAGLRIGTDNVEIAALAAPRPMKLVGADDWTDETMAYEYPTLKGVYALLGSPDRLSADKFDFPHNYNQTSRNAVYAFMGKWLAGIDDAASTREGEVKTEEPETLLVYGKDHPRPSDLKTAAELEADLVSMLARTIDRLAPRTAAVFWEADADLLRKALDVRVGLTDPAPLDLATAEVRKARHGGLGIAHSVVTWVPRSSRVPVVRITPEKPNGRATVVFSIRGKAGLLGPDGKPSEVVKALLDRGQSVIGLDPLFVGESLDPHSPTTHRPTVDHFEAYNPSLAADRAQDLATALAWARSRPDVREVSLVALPDAGPLALLARPMLPGLARTAIDLGGFDDGDGSGPVPPAFDLPGALQFGGLRAAAALSAPSPLWLAGVPEAFERAWPGNAYALAAAGGVLRIDEKPVEPSRLALWIDAGE